MRPASPAPVDEARQLSDAQGRKARQVKIQRLARQNPSVGNLLDEHTSLVATAAELRRQLAEANTRREIAEQSLANVRSDLTVLTAERDTLKSQLASALKPKR